MLVATSYIHGAYKSGKGLQIIEHMTGLDLSRVPSSPLCAPRTTNINIHFYFVTYISTIKSVARFKGQARDISRLVEVSKYRARFTHSREETIEAKNANLAVSRCFCNRGTCFPDEMLIKARVNVTNNRETLGASHRARLIFRLRCSECKVRAIFPRPACNYHAESCDSPISSDTSGRACVMCTCIVHK